MASINDALTALRDTISTKTGLRCVDITDSPPAPCAMVYPASPFNEDYFAAFKRGVFTLDVVVQPLISTTALRSAQNDLNDWLSPFGDKSIAQAIYDNPTLGTAATESTAAADATLTASVVRGDDYDFVTSVDGTRYLSAKLFVRIMTRGDR